MNKCIYTVITGGYDKPSIAPHFKGWDTILFTDELLTDSLGWEQILIESDDSPLIQSRDIKIRSHLYLSDYDLVCYIDGNQRLRKPPPNEPMWFTHAHRNTIFEEAEQIIKNGRFPANKINEMMLYYKKQGYKHYGL